MANVKNDIGTVVLLTPVEAEASNTVTENVAISVEITELGNPDTQGWIVAGFEGYFSDEAFQSSLVADNVAFEVLR